MAKLKTSGLKKYQVPHGMKWTVGTGGGGVEIQRGPLEVMLTPNEAAEWIRLGRLIPMEEGGNHLIELVQNGELSRKIIDSLVSGGFDTVESVKNATNKQLMEVNGIGEQALLKTRDAVAGLSV